MDKLGLPEYCLDQIDETTVAAELQRLGIEIGGRFEDEVRRLLQRPFYFQYVASGTVRLPREAHPRDFYKSFLEGLRRAFAARFSGRLDIEKALSLAAYDALNRGEEAFPLSELLRVLKTSMETVGLVNTDVRDITNWLVAFSVLVPHTGSRVAFVHQSVTEYLAAAELARRYQSSPYILKEKLSLTRWDQALFLTLSLLPSELAEMFFQDVVRADFVLALEAAKYLEVGRDEVVARLLSEIPERIQALPERTQAWEEPFSWEIASAVQYDLPLTSAHEPHLRTLINCGDMLGAAAVSRLVALKGAEVKDELLQLLVEHSGDYNLCCSGIAAALRPFATGEDAHKIGAWADSIQAKVTPDSDDDGTDGFISGAAELLAELDLSVIRQEFLPQDKSVEIPKIRSQILCDILQEHHSTAALDFAGELLLRGVSEAATAIYFIAKFADPDCKLSWDSFTTAHVDRLESSLDDPDEGSWGMGALKCLCAVRPDLAEFVKQKASKKSGVEKATLLHCVSPSDLKPIFQVLGKLVEMGDEERRQELLVLPEPIEFDWTGKEELFIRLLRLRDVQLASALFGNSCPPTVPGLGNLEIGQIDWWLEWMTEVDPDADGQWFCNQLGALFAEHLDRKVQDEFVAEFNKSGSKYRQLLLHFVLSRQSDITTEVFSEDAISFLLADLSREGSVTLYSPGHLLGNAATEQFITERLLPLLPGAKEPLLGSLHEVLRQAGSRHGRRYVLEQPV